MSGELSALEKAVAEIMEIASGMGLDFFPLRLEVVPPEIMYTFGASGMPTRFAHWSFGKAYHRMKAEYDYNLSRIYELVINSNPCYAFLLDRNSLLQNKLVVAHVLAHNDFFKNNAHFAATPRDMIQRMAANAERVVAYEFEHGREAVEKILDAALALQYHINPRLGRGKASWGSYSTGRGNIQNHARREQEEVREDLLYFILENAQFLADWERDLVAMVRGEALYFLPQLQTKVMNEGWATFWHLRIMRELELAEAEALDFARLHATIVQPNPQGLNPYRVGLAIFEDIAARQGIEKIFEVREVDDDLSFFRNYLTAELIDTLDLYLYARAGDRWVVVEKDWRRVRESIIATKVNHGFPFIRVKEDDYGRRGELFLEHVHDGRDLDQLYLEKTLPYVFQLWGRPVHLETQMEGREVIFSYAGRAVEKRG